MVNHKRTRRWKADPMAMFRVINRIEPFNTDELMRIELPIRMSFESLRSGKGTESDFHDLAAAINTTLVRSESIDPLCQQTAVCARDALMRCWDRYQHTGKWGFDGPAFSAIDAGLTLHEELIRLSTPQQLVQALRTVIARSAEMVEWQPA